mgnify:CR=1 FL=1
MAVLDKAGVSYTILENEPATGAQLDFLIGAADETKSAMEAFAEVANQYKNVVLYDPVDAKTVKVYLTAFIGDMGYDVRITPAMKAYKEKISNLNLTPVATAKMNTPLFDYWSPKDRWGEDIVDKFVAKNMRAYYAYPTTEEYFDIKFDVSELLRTDKKSQAEYFTKLFNLGVLSPNDIRKELDMNAIEGGDIHVAQVNLTSIKNLETINATADNRLKEEELNTNNNQEDNDQENQ